MIKLKFQETRLFNSEVRKTPEDMFYCSNCVYKIYTDFFFKSMTEFIKKIDAMMSLVTVFNCCMQKTPDF